MKTTIQLTTSARATERLARKLGPALKGQNIFLFGPLGSGKTTFVRGLARALKIKEPIKSPTFVTEIIYALKHGKLIHLDLYRFPRISPFELKRLQELWQNANFTFVGEWSERLKSFPTPRYEISFREKANEHREIEIRQIT